MPNVNAAQLLSDARVYERAQIYERVPIVNIAEISSQDTCTNSTYVCQGFIQDFSETPYQETVPITNVLAARIHLWKNYRRL